MILPPSLSPSALDDARKLVRRRLELTHRFERLSAAVARCQARYNKTMSFLSERLDFQRHPDRLAGIAELFQRNQGGFRTRIAFDYSWLLRDMIDPLPSLQPGLPAPKPRKIDFHALDPTARPYLLGPYLGIHPGGVFAEVCLASARPSEGHVVIVQRGGPIDVDLWRAQLPAISAWLGGTWYLTDHAASTLTLTKRVPLPKLIPYTRAHLVHGALFAGIDVVARAPLHIPFAELTAGTYVPGASGSGKTTAIHILLRSIFANLDLFAAVYLVDGKDGVAMARYADVHPKVRVLYDEPDVWALTAELATLMRTRNAEQRAAGTDKATKDFVALVIDELPTYIPTPSDKEAKKAHAAFLEDLQRIAMRGRSAGIRMILITQSPVADQIPVAVRTNCATTIAFRLPENAHVTAVLGILDATNDPRKLPTGQAIVLQSETGRITTVQFPFAPLYVPPLQRLIGSWQ